MSDRGKRAEHLTVGKIMDLGRGPRKAPLTHAPINWPPSEREKQLELALATANEEKDSWRRVAERLEREKVTANEQIKQKEVAIGALTAAGISLGSENARLRAEVERMTRELAALKGTCGARPRVVCLCGSTRFKEAFEAASRRETLQGKIVLSVGLFGHLEGLDMGGPEKKMLDGLHLKKIDLADEVLCLNVGGYIGESTRRELAYATAHGKPIRYLEGGQEQCAAADDCDGCDTCDCYTSLIKRKE